ncbi:DNA-methyltransferase [Methylobacterium nodulans]|uniref:Methyltransferase n=1 Tax=Methylobacterium nodulans (strain LMG 21967 / CNCM I-2342 / ORS 2060) TaxID=460265 RepID=B8IXG7_METNO|nr:DNA methyltransferase [Methylobacterium nodulans]ACL63208.1 DNA methylase N-4/N-6 domain protein [Methylobacterium nodulans ORS 2060]
MTANVFASHISQRFAAYHVDTVEFTKEMPDDCVDFSVYSPPFSSLYIYSESERDMGNVGSDDEFQAHYRYLVKELFRITKPGRLTAIHVKDLVYYSNASERGDRGIRDFTGACIRTHVQEGWSFHRRITIDRCPVREMQKTKSDRLLYKNFRTDAARTGGGLPEYIVVFRKWADGMDAVPPVLHDPAEHPLESWQDLAQPIWMTSGIWYDTDETDVLNVRVARDAEAEKHLCPMPLDLTERLVRQYTNPDETVYSPFMGIGSEGYQSLLQGRRFIGTELKQSYYTQAVRYLTEAEQRGTTATLFTHMAAAE